MEATAIEIAAQGDPSVIEVIQRDVGAPAAGEVTLRHTVMGVNFMDVYQRSGMYPLDLPSGLGLEAAGVVEAVGADVEGIGVGDRGAYAGGPPGAYATHRNVAARFVVPIPDGVSDEQAAAALLKGMTVEYLLERCRPVVPGEWVLFYAAAGGVGSLAGQWGAAIGARMIGVAGGQAKCEQAKARGYEVVIDRTQEDIAARVKEVTDGAGVPVAFDSVGKATFEATVDSLAPRGMFVSFGASSGKPPDVPAALLQHKGSLYFTRPTLANYVGARADLEASAAKVFRMLASGKIAVEIGQRMPLTEARAAHEALEGGKTMGTTLLVP